MNEQDKQEIIQSFNIKLGDDINNLAIIYELENEIVAKRDALRNSRNVASTEVPTSVSASINKAKKNSSQIAELTKKSEKLQKKVDEFLVKTEPLRNELNNRFAAIDKLEKVFCYLKSYEDVDNLCRQLSSCNEDELSVQLYGELKELCLKYNEGHRGTYVKDYTHYWHNILKDKLTKQYEDVLKLLKWPVVMTADSSPLPKDVMAKFHGLTKFLFLIEEPEDEQARNHSGDFSLENPCLPVKILLKAFKKRFTFHFTGPRQTARLDRPEWFLTQTLTWIRDHQGFVKTNVQPVADKLHMRHIRTVDEFNAGLISFAAERLHTVLGIYNAQGAKNENNADMDAAFAHAVDEALGFHKELVLVTGHYVNSVLSVLTKAEIFVRWLAVEKKYALAKMDETLDNEQWKEPIAGGGEGPTVGKVMWVPRGADWFVALLKTIEDRFAVLPQPGHRLQFLELQLELIEEWRVRLTQIMRAAASALEAASFLSSAAPDPLSAVVNAAHHTRCVLLQAAHSLHYLQLHYYRRQFQHFTQQQHRDDSEPGSDPDTDNDELQGKQLTDHDEDKTLSLRDVEHKAKVLALNEVSRRSSAMPELDPMHITSPGASAWFAGADEAGVFAEAPALLARLRDAGLAALADHALLEFKAAMRDYRRQNWHAMLVVEDIALCVSAPLCRPLAALCARLATAAARLAPPLTVRLRGYLADNVDEYIFEEVVLESWFNTGGTLQFTHDVKRNFVPAFAPPNKSASQYNQLPKLLDSCKLLNMEYDDANTLRAFLKRNPDAGAQRLLNEGVRAITPAEALRILSQRTDLNNDGTGGSVMDLF